MYRPGASTTPSAAAHGARQKVEPQLAGRLDDVGIGAMDEGEAASHHAGQAAAPRTQPFQRVPGPAVMCFLVARRRLQQGRDIGGMIGAGVAVAAVLVAALLLVGD